MDGTLQVCVPQTHCFLLSSIGVCDQGPLKTYFSVLLMCFMSQGWALAGPMDSLPHIVWCGLIAESGSGSGKTPFTPQSIRFDLTRWCNADQQTGENVCHCACGSMQVGVGVGGTCVCMCVRAYVLVWAINAFIIHCFKTCVTHTFFLPLKTSHVSYAFTLKGIYVHLCCK